MSAQRSKSSTPTPAETAPARAVTFTRAGLRKGARLCVPLYPGAIAFGMSFGALAASKGLSLLEASLLSLFVFAGASQVAALEVWTDPLPIASVIAVTAIVNSRMLLASASLFPWAAGVRGWQRLITFYFLADGNWAVGMAQYRQGERDLGVIAGGGLVFALLWTPVTALGYLLGSVIRDPRSFGLDMLVPLFFLSMLVPLWNLAGPHRSDGRLRSRLSHPNLLPWATAALVAGGLHLVMDSHWYLLIGALAGASVAALQPVAAEPTSSVVPHD